MDLKEIEKNLASFKTLEMRIDNEYKKLERAKFQGSPRDITAVDFSKVGSGGCGQKSAEKALIDTQKILDKINELEERQNILNDALSILKKEYDLGYKFVAEYYLKENTDIMDVALILGYSYNSRKTIYKIKNKTFKILSEIL